MNNFIKCFFMFGFFVVEHLYLFGGFGDILLVFCFVLNIRKNLASPSNKIEWKRNLLAFSKVADTIS